MRQARIASMVSERGFVSIPAVAEEFLVSEMTIRRDLTELERSGLLVRTHGGAMSSGNLTQHMIDNEEPAFARRLQQSREIKQRIAATAAELVGGSRTVALDVGTTTFHLAENLAERLNLMVFTNSLRIASLLNSSGHEVYVPGGQVRRDEMSVYGPTAIAQFDKLWFDVAFIGVSGLTGEGIFDYSPEDSELKRVYLRRSERKIVLCDSRKFRRMSLVQVAALSEFDVLVTDQEPPPEIMGALLTARVAVRIARAAEAQE